MEAPAKPTMRNSLRGSVESPAGTLIEKHLRQVPVCLILLPYKGIPRPPLDFVQIGATRLINVCNTTRANEQSKPHFKRRNYQVGR